MDEKLYLISHRGDGYGSEIVRGLDAARHAVVELFCGPIEDADRDERNEWLQTLSDPDQWYATCGEPFWAWETSVECGHVSVQQITNIGPLIKEVTNTGTPGSSMRRGTNVEKLL